MCIDAALLFFLGAFGGLALFRRWRVRLRRRPLRDAGPLFFAGARGGDRDLGLQPSSFLVSRLVRGGGRDRGEPGALFFSCVLDRGGGLDGEPGALVFAGAGYRGDRGFGLEPPPFFLRA